MQTSIPQILNGIVDIILCFTGCFETQVYLFIMHEPINLLLTIPSFLLIGYIRSSSKKGEKSYIRVLNINDLVRGLTAGKNLISSELLPSWRPLAVFLRKNVVFSNSEDFFLGIEGLAGSDELRLFADYSAVVVTHSTILNIQHIEIIKCTLHLNSCLQQKVFPFQINPSMLFEYLLEKYVLADPGEFACRQSSNGPPHTSLLQYVKSSPAWVNLLYFARQTSEFYF